MSRSSQLYDRNGPAYGLVFPWESESSLETGRTSHELKDGLGVYTSKEISPRSEADSYSQTFKTSSNIDHYSSLQAPSNREYWTYSSSSWLPEIICCIVSILAMIAVVIILHLNDGAPPTNILYHITLNSLIEFMTSISKFAFMVPLVSGLGQLKWLWFKNEAQPLRDFQLHENAGSGGLASLRFAMTLRILFKSPIAWLAAVTAVSGFFTSPLTQQAISYASVRKAQSNGTASVRRATDFSRPEPSVFTILDTEQLLVQEAYLAAAYLGSNQTLPGVDPICSTGDCTWPTYSSLGVCAEVIDFRQISNTSLLTEIRNAFLIELKFSMYTPIFSSIEADRLYYITFMIPFFEPSLEFKEAPAEAIITQSFIGYVYEPVNLTDPIGINKIQFAAVSLYFCVQSFATNVKGGVHTTTQLSQTSKILESTAPTFVNAFWTKSAEQPATDLVNYDLCPGPMSGTSLTLAGPPDLPEEKFTIDACTALNLSSLYLLNTGGGVILKENLRTFAIIGQISQALAVTFYGNDASLGSAGIPGPDKQFANVERMMKDIARSLTSYMRTRTHDDSIKTVTGTTFAPQTIIQIRWSFLVFLVLQLALTMVVLFFTVTTTRRNNMQILKGNSLATMCALSEESKGQLGEMGDMEGLERKARQMRAVLRRHEEGKVLGLDVI